MGLEKCKTLFLFCFFLSSFFLSFSEGLSNSHRALYKSRDLSVRAGSQAKEGVGVQRSTGERERAAAAPFVAGGRFGSRARYGGGEETAAAGKEKKGADVTAVRGPVQN